MLTIEKQYDLFKTTLKNCSSLKTQTDDMKEYLLFEILNIDIPCYLSDYILQKLKDEYLIDGEIARKCYILRELYFSIENNKAIYNINMINFAKEWDKIKCFADEILGDLYM